MTSFVDFLRFPLRTLQTLYEPKPSTKPVLEYTVKSFDTDSIGQLSGWVDRKGARQGFLGLEKGPVDMQLPESFYVDRSEVTSITEKQFENRWNYTETPKRAVIRPPEPDRFEQVFLWQPYTRQTRMPFSQMPTVY